jgi:clan AA aspartic protease
MTGTVRAREAHIRIKVRGPNGQREQVEAVIDTGFTGWLTLPPSLISSLGLRWTNKARGLLADGRESFFDVFEAKVYWNRRLLFVRVEEAATTPLVGMSLLDGCKLSMEVRPGGKVSIKPLGR